MRRGLFSSGSDWTSESQFEWLGLQIHGKPLQTLGHIYELDRGLRIHRNDRQLLSTCGSLSARAVTLWMPIPRARGRCERKNIRCLFLWILSRPIASWRWFLSMRWPDHYYRWASMSSSRKLVRSLMEQAGPVARIVARIRFLVLRRVWW